MPYRSSREALESRRASLEAELATIHDETKRLDALKRREADVARELWETEKQIGAAPKARRTLPLLPSLDDVRIATPCRASWDDMVGDDEVRFCKSCQKNVYDLSALTRESAEALIRKHENGTMCARLYRRDDGTVLTSDCSVGLQTKRARQFAVAAAGGSLLAASVLSQVAELPGVPGRTMGEMRIVDEMGDVAPPVVAPPPPPASPPPPVRVEPRRSFSTHVEPARGIHQLGGMRVVPPTEMPARAPLPTPKPGGPSPR